MTLNSLDHVALWTDERERLARLLIDCCGMHEIERTDRFTLVGGDARLGKLTLFDAEGPRDPGVLERVVLRVPDPDEAAERLAAAGAALDADGGMATAETAAGLALGLVPPRTGSPTSTASSSGCRAPRPPSPASRSSGSSARATTSGSPARTSSCTAAGRPRGSGRCSTTWRSWSTGRTTPSGEARSRGIEVADVVDAPNTRAVFVWGPDRIKLEYVEHKPGFSLV